jgi:hypothetical protein
MRVGFNVLSTIESISSTETQLDSDFKSFNECGSRGLCINRSFFCQMKMSSKVKIDECDTAAEMYSCAVDKIPNLLPEMIIQDSSSKIVQFESINFEEF